MGDRRKSGVPKVSLNPRRNNLLERPNQNPNLTSSQTSKKQDPRHAHSVMKRLIAPKTSRSCIITLRAITSTKSQLIILLELRQRPPNWRDLVQNTNRPKLNRSHLFLRTRIFLLDPKGIRLASRRFMSQITSITDSKEGTSMWAQEQRLQSPP